MTRKEQIRKQCETLARERAQRIGVCAWYDCASEVLTKQEQGQVRELWYTMPGHTCWMDAFLQWMKTEDPTSES